MAEARAARRRGAQALIVQGSEAGGHNRAGAAIFALLAAATDVIDSATSITAPRELTEEEPHLRYQSDDPSVGPRVHSARAPAGSSDATGRPVLFC